MENSTKAALFGLSAVAAVGLGAWLLSGQEFPTFGVVTLADLDEHERTALKHLQDPDYEFPNSPIWHKALKGLQDKSLMYTAPVPGHPGYIQYLITNLGERVLAGIDPKAPVPITARSQVSDDSASATRSKKKYSLSWEESV
jgi:hypothetical protein